MSCIPYLLHVEFCRTQWQRQKLKNFYLLYVYWIQRVLAGYWQSCYWDIIQIEMLRNFVQLSLKSIHNTKFIKVNNLTSITRCRYSRYVSRKHAAIVNENELFDDNTKTDTIKPNIKKHTAKLHKQKPEKKEKAKPEEESDIKKPIYTALKENDKLIRYVIC